MEATDPQFALLEKPISSSRAGLEVLRRVCPDNTYVNFPRRYSPLHLEAIKRAALFPREQIKIVVRLPWPTMLSNASHFIDFASELIGQAPMEVVLELDKVTPVASKRRGFMDLQGEMSVTYPSNTELIIDTSVRSEKTADTGVTISVQSGSNWLRIDERDATLSDSTGEQTKIPGTPLQSQLTGYYLEQLQVRGFLDLPTFIEALPAHERLLTAVEAIEQELSLELPFT
jgi:predicted dehydrogenase